MPHSLLITALLDLVSCFAWIFGAASVMFAALPVRAVPQGWTWRAVLSDHRLAMLLLGLCLVLLGTATYTATNLWIAP